MDDATKTLREAVSEEGGQRLKVRSFTMDGPTRLFLTKELESRISPEKTITSFGGIDLIESPYLPEGLMVAKDAEGNILKIFFLKEMTRRDKAMTKQQKKWIIDWETVTGMPFHWDEKAEDFSDAVDWNLNNMHDSAASAERLAARAPV